MDRCLCNRCYHLLVEKLEQENKRLKENFELMAAICKGNGELADKFKQENKALKERIQNLSGGCQHDETSWCTDDCMVPKQELDVARTNAFVEINGLKSTITEKDRLIRELQFGVCSLQLTINELRGALEEISQIKTQQMHALKGCDAPCYCASEIAKEVLERTK